MNRLVIVNQEVNYLTTDLANDFADCLHEVILITGKIHQDGQPLDSRVRVINLNPINSGPAFTKAISFGVALLQIWWTIFTRFRRDQVLFVSTPPMGYLLNIVLPNQLSMIIWDLYPDCLKVKGITEGHWIYAAWSRLNRISFAKAKRIYTIGETLAEGIRQYTTRTDIFIQPLWTRFKREDKVPRQENPFIVDHGLQDKFVVQYSGNIGLSHDIEVLLDIAQQLRGKTNIFFQIIGRGERFPQIENALSKRDLPNIALLPFQSPEAFRFSLSAADLGVVVLNEEVSRGSAPSKAYNLMAFGIPSLYIASPDSQLAADAVRFNHARCFSRTSIDQMASFIVDVCEDRELRSSMSMAALQASKFFGRENAKAFVNSFLSD
jgi:glycosyltransferase involved in cell wall biosynthesis